ncbi:ras and Rab interactor 3 [Xenopus laevis]|uniref:Ras and Rab interactor 3 n=2 Tax=Xenopus laevis TaxID=8355 RepID=A0A1L8H6B0_XENLA|nr:ras and Rab interactor 3 [Xenopus laevis]XP_018104689.1 ras and Rab interactor 3 [Xenopus laevis]OCT91649.1 hypothetical protein XELAEV_18014708mg [Xenopus laevis]
MSPSNTASKHFCSIQVTSENGALCIINPLFLHEHGDTWLTDSSQNKMENRMSVPWCYGQSGNRGSMDWRRMSIYGQRPGNIRHGKEDVIKKYSSETDGLLDVCRRLSIGKDNEVAVQIENSTTGICLNSEVMTQKKTNPPETAKEAFEGSQEENVPLEDKASEWRNNLRQHRVSWVEVEHSAELKKCSSETSLSSSDSFLLPPPPEIDSVSISSIEEDMDCHSINSGKKYAHGLGDMVRHSLLAVSTILSGLVSPEKHFSNRIKQLAEDPSCYLGSMVQRFYCHMFKESGQYKSSIDMLQNIRQLITNLKSHLLESNEIWEILEHQEIDEYKLTSIVEASLYKCVLKPTQDVIYSQLLDFHRNDGSLTKLLENQEKMKRMSSQNLCSGVPGPVIMEKIQNKLSLMHITYSPEKMIRHLLKVCKLIYESMETASGKKGAFGADDFLPVLIHVLLSCDLTSLQLDVEYIMELVDPSQLQGEGGYYLTTLFGALYHIGSFNTVSRQLSAEAQNSIRQWQRRRTVYYKSTSQNRSKNIKNENSDAQSTPEKDVKE